MRARVALAVLAAAIMGCDKTPFDPATVELLGAWTLDRESTIFVAGQNGWNPCRLLDVPVTITDLGNDTLGIMTEPGGTLQCAFPNQPFGPVSPAGGGEFFFLTRLSTDSVELHAPPAVQLLRGRLISANRAEGIIVPDSSGGRSGTWTLTR